MSSSLVQIGKIVANIGLKGQVVLQHLLEKKLSFQKDESIFIETEPHRTVPYFVIQAIAMNSKETKLLLEGIHTKELSFALVKKNIWLTQEQVDSKISKVALLNWLGFQVYQNKEHIGWVKEVIQLPHQPLLNVKTREKEALLPFHKDFIVYIDKKEKHIYMNLPDGLLSM